MKKSLILLSLAFFSRMFAGIAVMENNTKYPIKYTVETEKGVLPYTGKIQPNKKATFKDVKLISNMNVCTMPKADEKAAKFSGNWKKDIKIKKDETKIFRIKVNNEKLERTVSKKKLAYSEKAKKMKNTKKAKKENKNCKPCEVK
ncbi:hypothetical protein KJ644_00505 [Candidatus Dependentiae bacterium]|nr:hypothetical protein [Candidatus Dependentiae bacterium]MBU4386935.1 hypothetical protein [Candidatus Dependentiae bacterium]MCG2756412.1 hypothetical protein [Candidatus Dependentiae bacterium]